MNEFQLYVINTDIEDKMIIKHQNSETLSLITCVPSWR